MRSEEFCTNSKRTNAARKEMEWYNKKYANLPSRLSEVYSEPSDAKVSAYWECIRMMEDLSGWGARILHAGVQTFSVGFLYPDSETGVIKFAYLTRDYNSTCDWEIPENWEEMLK